MAKKEEFTFDTEATPEYTRVEIKPSVEKETIYKKVKQEKKEKSEGLVNPLRNEKVSV